MKNFLAFGLALFSTGIVCVADERDEEIRLLRAENKMLRATIASLRAVAPTTQPLIKCGYCRGLENVPCDACRSSSGSTGLTLCYTCKGSKTVACDRCDGREYECTPCDGSGRIGDSARLSYQTCGTCLGTGKVIGCASCTKGRIKCPTCNGAGRLGECTKCYGKKTVPCPKCSSPTETEQPVPTGSRQPAHTGYDNVVKALKKYAPVYRSNDATAAQKAEAYSVFCTAIAEMPLTVTYTVDDVTIADDDTASISAITDQKNRDGCIAGSISLSIKIPRATALQLKKGNILTVTGTVENWTPSYRNRRPVGSVNLGRWVVATAEGYLEPVRAGNDGSIEVMAKKGFVVTLNGKRVEAVVPEGR